MLSTPGVLHTTVLIAGPRGQRGPTRHTHRSRGTVTGEELADNEVSGGTVTTIVLSTSVCIY